MSTITRSGSTPFAGDTATIIETTNANITAAMSPLKVHLDVIPATKRMGMPRSATANRVAEGTCRNAT